MNIGLGSRLHQCSGNKASNRLPLWQISKQSWRLVLYILALKVCTHPHFWVPEIVIIPLVSFKPYQLPPCEQILHKWNHSFIVWRQKKSHYGIVSEYILTINFQNFIKAFLLTQPLNQVLRGYKFVFYVEVYLKQLMIK